MPTYKQYLCSQSVGNYRLSNGAAGRTISLDGETKAGGGHACLVGLAGTLFGENY